MPSDNDIKKDWDEAHDQSIAHWSPYLVEAKKDLEFALGKQYTQEEESYLKGQGREALVFRKNHRVTKLITGFERKNRLSIKIDPVEGSDEKTANQFTALTLLDMQRSNTYQTLSEAFEQGPCKSGMNLINLFLDFREDPLNGDFGTRRVPYNRFLLDPNTFDRTLKDCGYILRREFLTPKAASSIVPQSIKSEVRNLTAKGRDGKFNFAVFPQGVLEKELLLYDEFWQRDYVDFTVLIDPASGKQVIWKGSAAKLREFQQFVVSQGAQEMLVLKGTRETVKLHIIIEDEVRWSGQDPLGIADYPFVWEVGFWDPEADTSDLRVQSVTRINRDPQKEVNKRRSKMLDILDSQITSGWMAKAGTVVNEQDLYKSGQGQVVWMNKTANMEDAKQLRAADIPAGLFAAIEIVDRDVETIPGATSELLGSPDNNDIEVAGILAKMRSNAGLTVLQDLFDHHRLVKKEIGRKYVKMVQGNYDANKVQRMINEQPSKEFYDRKFGKYDSTAVEGLLTDSQRQMYFAQLMGMQRAGAPIPWSEIMEVAPFADKESLKQAFIKAEEAQKAQSEQQAALMKMQVQLLQTKILEGQADIKKDTSQAAENRTNAMLDQARAIKELQGIDFDQAMRALEFIQGSLTQNTSGSNTIQ